MRLLRAGTCVLAVVAGWVGLVGSPATAQVDCDDLPKPSGYVVDQARVVDDAVERSIGARLEAFEATTGGHQVAVLVAGSIGDESLEDYANDVFGCWGVGKERADTGVLLVVAVEQRRLRIEVGRGVEDELTDVESADIIRDVITPHFRSGDYSAGVRDGVEAIVRALGGTPVGQPLRGPARPAPSTSTPSLVFGLVLLGLVVLSAVGGRGGRRGRRGGFGDDGVGGLWPGLILGSMLGGGHRGGYGGYGGSSGGGGFGGGGFGGFGGGGSSGGGASGGW
ncbi:MAG TPA: TPM domain-containing protein [Mycobacteriales bacterium]|nr:TPM domain-containing protein [Mycobacteriales bacterium]